MAAAPEERGGTANDAAWEDVRNWTWPGVYHAPRDTRLVVPKRPVTVFGVDVNLGWTLNFAHSGAFPSLVGLVGLPLIALQLLPRRRRGAS